MIAYQALADLAADRHRRLLAEAAEHRLAAQSRRRRLRWWRPAPAPATRPVTGRGAVA